MLDPMSPPEFITQRWFNTDEPVTLASQKGKVIVLAAFQTHCPGSLKHGLPQAQRMAQTFSTDEVVVIGLNTAFEELDKQAAGALEAFIQDKGFTFPIAKDKPNGGELPRTMDAYQIQGTPAILVFDRQGRLRRHYLGQVEDIRLAAEVMALVIEPRDAERAYSAAIERRLAAALVDPDAHAGHEGCGCGHEHHDHDHHHGHDHSHGHTHDDHVHSADGSCCGHDPKGGHEEAAAPPAKLGKAGKSGKATSAAK